MEEMSDPTIFLSAGEASGEHYGTLLLAALQERLSALGQHAEFFGMGGERMASGGLDCVVRSEDVAVMGITEVVRHLPRIYREFRRLREAIRARRPSVAILIDFPDFHFKLAEEFHALGIPVLFFVSPQLWAWKKHRLKLVQKYVDKMLVIFPFEEQFYREHGVKAEFVGHPLAELPLPTISREEFARAHQLDPAKPWIGLLPGSRAKEIRANLPEMLRAAGLLAQKAGPIEFVLPLAPTLTAAHRARVVQLIAEHAPGLAVRLIDDARPVLFHARASVVASGTATVEAALIGNPFVVVYRVSPLTYAIAKRVVTVKDVAMVNLIAGRRIVPELIQGDFTAENIVQHLEPLLPDGPPRQSMMEELGRMRARLQSHTARPGTTSGAIGRVADITLETLGLTSPVVDSVPF
jgi:lipid-A-disaccharide synthase